MARRSLDKYLQRAMLVIRVSEGEANRVSAKLKKAHQKIKDMLNDPKWFETHSKMKSLQKEIQKILLDAYSVSYEKAERLAAEMSKKEVIWHTDALTSAAAVDAVKPDVDKAFKKAWTKPYNGKKFETWFKRAGMTDIKRVEKAIRAGFVTGKTGAEIVQDLLGNFKGREADVRTLVRSSMQHASAVAKDDVFDANKENGIIIGKIWRSTLDIRTTADICGVRDGLEYDLDNNPIGHGYAWGAGPGSIHFNCRSTSIPLVKGVSKTSPRVAVGAGENYERGDHTTRSGRVRKSSRNSVERGIFEIERRTTKTTYEGWLKSQPIDFVADALGSKEAAKKFKDGTPLNELTNNPLGKPKKISAI